MLIGLLTLVTMLYIGFPELTHLRTIVNPSCKRISRERRPWEQTLRIEHKRTWRLERRIMSYTLPVPGLSVGLKLTLCSPKICGTAKKISYWLSPKGGCTVTITERHLWLPMWYIHWPVWLRSVKMCIHFPWVQTHSHSLPARLWARSYTFRLGHKQGTAYSTAASDSHFLPHLLSGFWDWRRFYLLQLHSKPLIWGLFFSEHLNEFVSVYIEENISLSKIPLPLM